MTIKQTLNDNSFTAKYYLEKEDKEIPGASTRKRILKELYPVVKGTIEEYLGGKKQPPFPTDDLIGKRIIITPYGEVERTTGEDITDIADKEIPVIEYLAERLIDPNELRLRFLSYPGDMLKHFMNDPNSFIDQWGPDAQTTLQHYLGLNKNLQNAHYISAILGKATCNFMRMGKGGYAITQPKIQLNQECFSNMFNLLCVWFHELGHMMTYVNMNPYTDVNNRDKKIDETTACYISDILTEKFINDSVTENIFKHLKENQKQNNQRSKVLQKVCASYMGFSLKERKENRDSIITDLSQYTGEQLDKPIEINEAKIAAINVYAGDSDLVKLIETFEKTKGPTEFFRTMAYIKSASELRKVF